MDIVSIIPDRIYSIKYDEDETSEYYRLFNKEWTDVDSLIEFFQSHSEYTENEFWGFLGNDPEKAAARVLKDAYMLEPLLKELAENSNLRLYAIRFTKNCYLIVYGGIKLNSSIQNSPELKDNVFQKIDKVKQYLVDENIIDKDDI